MAPSDCTCQSACQCVSLFFPLLFLPPIIPSSPIHPLLRPFAFGEKRIGG
jgi:hypothetical protein